MHKLNSLSLSLFSKYNLMIKTVIRIWEILLTNSILCMIIFLCEFISITDKKFPSPDIDYSSQCEITVPVEICVHSPSLKRNLHFFQMNSRFEILS